MSISAKDARAISSETEYRISGYTYQEMLEKQDKEIIKACKRGARRTCFEIHHTIWDEWETEMKRHYKQLGYWFEPTGYINGIWQQTEEICW